ncbi:hypothetical protein [Streptosporangium canum]|uniref:hypothetical protein n=1 Tax=Streptosporangium canum TaxID=324952 RepID=UPI0033BED2B7
MPQVIGRYLYRRTVIRRSREGLRRHHRRAPRLAAAVPLLATYPADIGTALPLLADILDRFAAAGIEQDHALITIQSVGVYVLGHALAQVDTPPGSDNAEPPPDRAALDHYERWFTTGLQAIVAGFQQQHGQR